MPGDRSAAFDAALFSQDARCRHRARRRLHELIRARLRFGYLAANLQPTYHRKLQAAYEKPTYAQAKASLMKVRSELAQINESAVASLEEGLEDTLTLHRLGLFTELGESFKTTNCLENLNSLVGQRTDKVDCWKNAEQKHRWLATTLLDIEPRLRKVRGHCQLVRLRATLQKRGLEAVA